MSDRPFADQERFARKTTQQGPGQRSSSHKGIIALIFRLFFTLRRRDVPAGRYFLPGTANIAVSGKLAV